MEEKSPLLSIILVVWEKHHLTPITLDSILSQEMKDYEIIIVETKSSKHDLQILKKYSSSIREVYSTTRLSPSSMMNKGLSLAKGKYVQFLTPGDSYLSPKGLSILFGEIEKNDYPDIIASSFLFRTENFPPELKCRSFSLEILKKGKIPTRLQSTWFHREMVKSLKGFDRKLRYRKGFDLFCRLLLQPIKPRVHHIHQVLIDYELAKQLPSEIVMYGWETAKTIKKYFGFFASLLWFLVYDHCRIVLWWLRSVKQFFY